MNDETDDVDPALDEEPEGLELTKESKPVPRRPHAREPKIARQGGEESQAGEGAKTNAANIEENYPGITEQIRRFVEAELPPCPYCGAENTASVQVGMTGRAKVIAEATTKVKLVPNAKDKLGIYFCNECGKYSN